MIPAQFILEPQEELNFKEHLQAYYQAHEPALVDMAQRILRDSRWRAEPNDFEDILEIVTGLFRRFESLFTSVTTGRRAITADNFPRKAKELAKKCLQVAMFGEYPTRLIP